MRKMKTKHLLRINFESVPDELGDDLCLVRGYLLMVQDPNNDWAYGYHIKYQGGGTVGDYHVVAKWFDDDMYWEFAYGNFIEPTKDDLLITAQGEGGEYSSKLDGFNVDSALNMIKKVNEIFYDTLRTGGKLEEVTPLSYDNLFLVFKSRLDNTKFESNSFWYRKDEFLDDDNIAYLDVESISETIPGNMVFFQ